MRTALGNAPMRTVPDSPVRAAASDAVAASRAASTVSVCCTRAVPAGVSVTPRPMCSSSGTPGLPLQRGELLRHRGRRVGVSLGHRGDGAQMGQVPQQAQAADIKH